MFPEQFFSVSFLCRKHIRRIGVEFLWRCWCLESQPWCWLGILFKWKKGSTRLLHHRFFFSQERVVCFLDICANELSSFLMWLMRCLLGDSGSILLMWSFIDSIGDDSFVSSFHVPFPLKLSVFWLVAAIVMLFGVRVK